jgi:hypothetical protein
MSIHSFLKLTDMNFEDETFLSAYMDGQLGPDDQQQVESVLVANPKLAEKLRVMTAVRDLVVGLHRDATVDVTHEVMDRIRQRRRSRSRFAASGLLNAWALRNRRAAGFITAAAGIILVVAVMQSLHRIHRAEPGPRNLVDNIITDSRSSTTSSSIDDGAATVALQPGPSESQAGVAQSVALVTGLPRVDSRAASPPSLSGEQANGDLELCRRLLDNPLERRFFVVKDGREGRAQQQVASVVEHTTRFGFCKITVSQGIVIDPRHPDQATVFALLVSPHEFERMRDQLKVALPDLIEETPADPGIVTMLADMSDVRACPPAPLADVSIPREALALRSKFASAAESAANSAPASGPKTTGRPSPETNRSDRVPATDPSGTPPVPELSTRLASAEGATREPDASAPARDLSSDPISGTGVARSEPRSAANVDRAKAEDLIVVLVWVSKPPPS